VLYGVCRISITKYTQLSERCSADGNSSIGCMKQNMFVYRYVLTIQFPFGMRAVICRYPGKGGKLLGFCHVVPVWNFTLLRACNVVGSSPPLSVIQLMYSGVLTGGVRYVFMF